MSHLCVLICRVDDDSNPDQMTELHRIDLPPADPSHLEPETSLDELESQTLAIGREVMRKLLVEHMERDRQTAGRRLPEVFSPWGALGAMATTPSKWPLDWASSICPEGSCIMPRRGIPCQATPFCPHTAG